MSEERLERIEGKVDILVSGQIRLEAQIHNVESRLEKVEGSQEELRASVMQIAEGHAALTRQISRGFKSLATVLDRRLEPLEHTVRKLSTGAR